MPEKLTGWRKVCCCNTGALEQSQTSLASEQCRQLERRVGRKTFAAKKSAMDYLWFKMFLDKHLTIMLVEDDENDSILLRRALTKNDISNPVQWMRDGLEALEHLQGHGKFADRNAYPFPHVVILDLKMPRLSGLELLAHLQDHPELKIIPTVVLSSSRLPADIETAYSLGANTYFVKPTDFNSLAKMVKTFIEYWSMGEKPEGKQNKLLSK
jgi:CheY-like chemotaxis protein